MFQRAGVESHRGSFPTRGTCQLTHCFVYDGAGKLSSRVSRCPEVFRESAQECPLGNGTAGRMSSRPNSSTRVPMHDIELVHEQVGHRLEPIMRARAHGTASRRTSRTTTRTASRRTSRTTARPASAAPGSPEAAKIMAASRKSAAIGPCSLEHLLRVVAAVAVQYPVTGEIGPRCGAQTLDILRQQPQIEGRAIASVYSGATRIRTNGCGQHECDCEQR